MSEFENKPMLMTTVGLQSLISNCKLMIEKDLKDKLMIGKQAFFEREDDDDEPDFNYSLEDNIAIINIKGTLIHNFTNSFYGFTGYDYITNALNQANNDSNVKGIVLNINSGGGEVSGCDECGLFIENSTKPVWAVANECAASAAYWLACSSSKIYLPKTASVGSVGVVMSHVSYKEMLKQDGIEHTYIYSGNKKVDGNPYNPLTDELKQEYKKELDMIRNLFVGKVAKNRKMANADVMNTEAGMYIGNDAVDIGFADKVGTLKTAISDMKSFLTKSPKKGTTKGASMDNQASQNGDLEQAKRDGAFAERMRIDSILNSEEAKGREAQATNLALKTNMNVAEITSLLSTFPVAQKADAAQANTQDILKSMSVGANAPSVISGQDTNYEKESVVFKAMMKGGK